MGDRVVGRAVSARGVTGVTAASAYFTASSSERFHAAAGQLFAAADRALSRIHHSHRTSGAHMTSCPRTAARRLRIAILTGAALFALTPAVASETITYTYDARGRLVKVAHSGTVNNNTSACYSYDKGDNRSNVNVATSSACVAGGSGGDPGGGGVTFSISSNGSVTEGANSVFTITKTGTATTSLTVSYATANATAVAPGDYTAKSGSLTFTTAQTQQTVSVTTIDDTTVENAETFKMTLSSPTGGATVGTGTATATINDNDSAGACSGVSFSVNNTSAVETNPLVFTVSKAGSTSGSCSVSYATANGSANSDDYAATSGTLSFTSTQTSKTVSVTTYSNGLMGPEPNETMYLNLSGATGGATISDSQGVGTIIDDGASGCQFCLQESPDGGTAEGSSGDSVTEPSDATEPPPPPESSGGQQ